MPFIALLVVLALVLSGSGNQRSELFTVEDGEHVARWSVESRQDSTCYFKAWLGRVEGDELVGFWWLADVTVLSGATADRFGTPRSASGEVRLDLPAGTYQLTVMGESMRLADGSTEACASYSVSL